MEWEVVVGVTGDVDRSSGEAVRGSRKVERSRIRLESISGSKFDH